MIRRVGACALAVAVLAGCSSDGGTSDAAAHKEATAFTCPPATQLEQAYGHSLADPKKSFTGSRTVLCAYTGPRSNGSAIVSVTFGTTSGDYDTALHALGDPDTTPVRGLGDKAATFTKDGVGQLIVRSGSRILTVTSDPGDPASETDLARVFLR